MDQLNFNTVENKENSNVSLIIEGKNFTKEMRQKMFGRVAGGAGAKKPSDYQVQTILSVTCRACPSTQMRINWRSLEMVEKVHPMQHEDGFDYTENFDGKQIFNDKTVWVNLKSVVGTGGSQTRTLRDECYAFVSYQLAYLLKSCRTDCFFANVFDGDEAFRRMPMFRYLLELPEFASVKKYIYVGDLREYCEWVNSSVS